MKQLFLRLDAFLDSGMDEKDDKDRLKHRFLVYVLLTPFDLDFVAVYLLLNIGRFGGVFGLGDFQKSKKGMILVSILLSMMRRWSFHESQPTSYFFFLCCLSL